MTMDRELVLRLAAQRAGFTENQLEALRRHDYTALLTEQPPVDGAPDDEDEESVGPTVEDLQADLRRVSRRLLAIRQQRDAALHLLRQLAQKLGCCAQCWGTDTACPVCGGQGSPGHFAPDPRLADWLAPALLRTPASGPRGAHATDRPPGVPLVPAAADDRGATG